MASIINAGTTTATALNITTDTTGAMILQTSGVNAISISSSQAVTLANPLPVGSGGTGLSSLGTGVATFLGTPSSANLRAAVTDETGTGALVFADSPSLTTPTISSANLTGTPTAPTAAVTTDTTQIATTEFVRNIIPTGIISMWSGSIASIPSGWLLCDGTNGTPDLRNRFVIGANADDAGVAKTSITGSPTQTGGTKDAIVVSHTHSVTDPGHVHTVAIGGSGGGAAAVGTVSQVVTINTGSATTGISIQSTGSSGTNQNLPPYFALAFIMKT